MRGHHLKRNGEKRYSVTRQLLIDGQWVTQKTSTHLFDRNAGIAAHAWVGRNKNRDRRAIVTTGPDDTNPWIVD